MLNFKPFFITDFRLIWQTFPWITKFGKLPMLKTGQIFVQVETFAIIFSYQSFEYVLSTKSYMWCVARFGSICRPEACNFIKKEILAACNFTKINTPLWVFFTFFKLYKCYQIAQRTTYMLQICIELLI